MQRLIQAAVDRGASVIHFKAGDVLRARIEGKIVKLSNQVFTEDDTLQIALKLISSEKDRERFDEIRDYDTSWGLKGVGRFRINISRQRGTVMVVMRVIPLNVPTLEELFLPSTSATSRRSSTVSCWSRGRWVRARAPRRRPWSSG